MWKTAVRRVLVLIPQLLVLSFLIFLLANFMPGDALTGKIDPNTSPARLEELRQKFGYYDPWYVKYGRWLTDALQGDLGESTFYKIPVTQLIGQRAGNTFWLSLMTTMITYAVAVPLGLLAGKKHDQWPDRAVNIYTYFALAVPTIVFGLVNIFFFSYRLGWFPAQGSVSVQAVPGTLSYLGSRIYHMLLPALTGGLLYTVSTIQYLRSEIIEYENADFAMTARSKGVPQRVIYSKHIFRNALIPVASFIGYDIAFMLSGSVFVERVFSYPGMGNLFIESIGRRDFAVVNALIILYAVLTVLGTLISDLLLTAVDPRIRVK